MAGPAVYGAEILKRLEGEGILGAEIGVDRGALSAVLLRDPRIVHLDMIDSWAGTENQPAHYIETGDEHALLSEHDQIARLLEAQAATNFAEDRRSILRLTSLEASRHVPDGFLDFAFLDGWHSKEGLAEDIASWTPKIKPGGLLCGHDYGRPDKLGGVKIAVDEAVEANGWELELGEDYTWFVRL